MRIHEFRDFPSPRRVRMFLAEKGIEGIPFDQVNVPNGEHRQAIFLSMSPYGTVPVLELEDGTYLSETVAISRYFEERYPINPLMGTTAKEKG